MEIQLTPELEARLVAKARQNGQTPGVYAAELLARDLELSNVVERKHDVILAPKSARAISELAEQEARNAPPVDWSEILGVWGRSGHAVDGLEFEREQRDEWP